MLIKYSNAMNKKKKEEERVKAITLVGVGEKENYIPENALDEEIERKKKANAMKTFEAEISKSNAIKVREEGAGATNECIIGRKDGMTDEELEIQQKQREEDIKNILAIESKKRENELKILLDNENKKKQHEIENIIEQEQLKREQEMEEMIREEKRKRDEEMSKRIRELENKDEEEVRKQLENEQNLNEKKLKLQIEREKIDEEAKILVQMENEKEYIDQMMKKKKAIDFQKQEEEYQKK